MQTTIFSLTRIVIILTICIGLLACSSDNIDLVIDNLPENEVLELRDFHVVIDGKAYFPFDTCGREINIIVPVEANLKNAIAYFDYTGARVCVDSIEQISGTSVVDFSNIVDGVKYNVLNATGGVSYNVRVLNTNLPVVIINTEKAIEDKVTWVGGNMIIQPDYESSTHDTYDNIKIKGRGNQTWLYPKKPYAIKLDKKENVLGMPKHKRWVLLSLWRGAIGHDLMFWCSRKSDAIEYTPRGEFVELILNNKFQGLYYLCEQIKVDKNRVNIAELKADDIEYPDVSGGYLLEYDSNYDEEYKFMSDIFQLPVNLKSPDENVNEAQISYIKDYVHKMESEFMKIETNEDSEYQKYIDVDNWVDYLLLLGAVSNYEGWGPRSLFMYKDRDKDGMVSKMKMGPMWDQEIFYVQAYWTWQYNLEANYFGKLHKDPFFLGRMKHRFPILKEKLVGNASNNGLLDYLVILEKRIGYSARRDVGIWKNDAYDFDDEVKAVKRDFIPRLDYIERWINNLSTN